MVLKACQYVILTYPGSDFALKKLPNPVGCRFREKLYITRIHSRLIQSLYLIFELCL